MKERRVVFNVGVIYHTPVEKMEAIPPMIKRVVEDHQHARCDRAHFKSFGDFALYNTYMDLQQSMNFRLIGEFQKAAIELPIPPSNST